MKYSLLVLSLILCVSLKLSAQNDTTDAEVQRLLSVQSKSPEAGIRYHLGGANSDVRFSSALPFVFKDYLNLDDKAAIIDDVSGRIRMGYWQEIELSYRQPGYYSLEAYKPGSGFVIRNNSYASAAGPSELAALALYGNRQFEDQTVDVNGSSYENWLFTSLAYQHQSVYDSIPFTVEFAFVVNHSYQKYSVQEAQLYTAPDGEYIDANLDYRLIDAGHNTGINGLGFSTGFQTTLPLSENFNLDLRVKDLGVVFLTNAQISRVDSSFRFQGGSFANLFEINDSLFSEEVDRITNGLYNRSGDGYTAFMPFHVRAQLNRQLDHSFFDQVYLFSEYRYLAGYIPKTGIGSVGSWKNQQWLAELYYGGFNSTGLRAQYSAQVFENYNIGIGTNNLLAVLPFIATGTSVYASVFYVF